MAPEHHLTDDLVLEIISWLPTKKALQCKTLNTYIYQCISNPEFANRHALQRNRQLDGTVETLVHFSAYKPVNFTKIDINQTTTSGRPNIFERTTNPIWIMASCNGLLLVLIDHEDYYVLNPITGGVAFIASYAWNDAHDVRTNPPGFAVDIDMAGRTTNFKLVRVLFEKDNELVRFNVVPSETTSDLLFRCRGFGGFASNVNLRPVYFDGYLHWLGKNGRKILAFNVVKKKIRILKGPGTVIMEDLGPYIWFGVARGSLSFVRTFSQGGEVFTYNYMSNKWQLVYREAVIPDGIREIVPVFYDGHHLFIQTFSTSNYREICMLDQSNGKWERRATILGWCDAKQYFLPFFPTLVKVSDEYLDNLNLNSHARIRLVEDDLLSLQRLFRQN